MTAQERIKQYKEEDFDGIILKIRNGTIKCGKFARKIKIGDIKIEKELFVNGDRKGK